MTTLHMETEEVRHKSNSINGLAPDVSSAASRLRSAASSLSSALQGGGNYSHDLNNCVSQLTNQADALSILANRVAHEVDEWEDVDNSAYQDLKCYGTATISPPPLGNWLWEITKDTKDAFEAFERLSNIPLAQYKSVGRWLNINLLENAKGGMVGALDDIGHFFKNPLVKDFGGPFLFEFINGSMENEDLAKNLLTGC